MFRPIPSRLGLSPRVGARRRQRWRPPLVADRLARRGARPAARHEGARPRLWPGPVVGLPPPRVRRAGLGHRPVVQPLGERPAGPRRRRRGRRLPDPGRRPVATVRRGVLRRRRVRGLVHVLRHGRPVSELPRPVRQAGRPGGHRPGRADGRDRRAGPGAPGRVVGRGAAVQPALGGLVAAALGAAGHPGRDGGRHPARRLAALAGLAPGHRSRERDGDPGPRGRRRPLPRLRPGRGPPPGRPPTGGLNPRPPAPGRPRSTAGPRP